MSDTTKTVKKRRTRISAMSVPGFDIVKWFWSKVDVQAPNKCWLWKYRKAGNGYGFFLNPKRYVQAHRYAYELVNGPIPAGLLICHKCDVKDCVNPNHLYAGTFSDNVRDVQERGDKSGYAKKLTPELVREIRASPRTIPEISKQYGLSYTTVEHVRKRRTWKHVP